MLPSGKGPSTHEPNRKSSLDMPASPLMYRHPLAGHALGLGDLVAQEAEPGAQLVLNLRGSSLGTL
jgi:hypothetical protein